MRLRAITFDDRRHELSFGPVEEGQDTPYGRIVSTVNGSYLVRNIHVWAKKRKTFPWSLIPPYQDMHYIVLRKGDARPLAAHSSNTETKITELGESDDETSEDGQDDGIVEESNRKSILTPTPISDRQFKAAVKSTHDTRFLEAGEVDWSGVLKALIVVAGIIGFMAIIAKIVGAL